MSPRQRAVLGAVFVASGGALAIYIVSGVSLAAALLLVGSIAVVVAALVWRRVRGEGREEWRRVLKAGLIAGALGTIAYDVSRFFIIEVLGLSIWPFDTFTLFGQALMGAGHEGPWVTILGTGYHVLNGIGFGVAYTIWFGRRGPLMGIGWAFVLEIFMLTLYPTWLDIRSVEEFLQVSVLGHVAYGVVLGFVSRRLLVQADGRSAQAESSGRGDASAH